MRNIIRILIFAHFAAIIFVPSIYMSRLALIPMFLSMGILVCLYWVAMFWVSPKDARKVLGPDLPDTLYVGKIPSDTTADLTRGRLCRHNDRLVLLKRSPDKERRTTPCQEAWSVSLSDITSVAFGKVLPARRGFILYLGDDEISFTCSKINKDRALLYHLLDWPIPTSPAQPKTPSTTA